MLTKDGSRMSDDEMLKQIWDEIRYVRRRLDDHVNTEDKSIEAVQKDLAKMREDMADSRVKLRMVLGGFGIGITGIISWMVSHIKSLS